MFFIFRNFRSPETIKGHPSNIEGWPFGISGSVDKKRARLVSLRRGD
jgi:hypothetical protein